MMFYKRVRYFYAILNKIGIHLQISVEFKSIRFHKNLKGSRLVARRQTTD